MTVDHGEPVDPGLALYDARMEAELVCILEGSDICLSCGGRGFVVTHPITPGRRSQDPMILPPRPMRCIECAGAGRHAPVEERRPPMPPPPAA